MMKPDSGRCDAAATRPAIGGLGAETGSAAGEERRLRAALGQLTTGVAVAAALTDEQLPVGMTINSFMPVSLSPPLVSWCIDRDASSLDAFTRTRRFAVTVLAEEQSGPAMRFAGRGADMFRNVDIRGDRPPVIPGGCAWFVCDSHCSILFGDHRMLIGRAIE